MQVQTRWRKVEKHYDLRFLFDYYGNDADGLREILSLFLQETPELLKTIGSHLAAGEYEAARSAAHKIKTNLAMLGIADAAGFMDHLHRCRDTVQPNGETELLFSVFRKEVERALAEIHHDYFRAE